MTFTPETNIMLFQLYNHFFNQLLGFQIIFLFPPITIHDVNKAFGVLRIICSEQILRVVYCMNSSNDLETYCQIPFFKLQSQVYDNGFSFLLPSLTDQSNQQTCCFNQNFFDYQRRFYTVLPTNIFSQVRFLSKKQIGSDCDNMLQLERRQRWGTWLHSYSNSSYRE